MMTTYELIRRLVQIDPVGNKPVMISIKTIQDNKEYEASGFIEELWVEHAEDELSPFIVITSVDN